MDRYNRKIYRCTVVPLSALPDYFLLFLMIVYHMVLKLLYVKATLFALPVLKGIDLVALHIVLQNFSQSVLEDGDLLDKH